MAERSGRKKKRKKKKSSEAVKSVTKETGLFYRGGCVIFFIINWWCNAILKFCPLFFISSLWFLLWFEWIIKGVLVNKKMVVNKSSNAPPIADVSFSPPTRASPTEQHQIYWLKFASLCIFMLKMWKRVGNPIGESEYGILQSLGPVTSK